MEELSSKFIEKLEVMQKEYAEAQALTQAVEVCQDNRLLAMYNLKINRLGQVMGLYSNYKQIQEEIQLATELTSIETDAKKCALLKAEIREKEDLKKQLSAQVQSAYQDLLKKQNERTKIEICNFSGNQIAETLTKMVLSYSANVSYSIEQPASKSGTIEVIVEGDNSYHNLSKLSGLYCQINRGAEQSASLLVFHDSQVNFEIDPDDVRVEVSKSSGAGGQHINKTESAVRLIHEPTGITAECQDERSQTKNKQRALENLKQKVCEFYRKNNKKQYDFEKKMQKNAIFSKTPKFIIDFDKNKFINLIQKQNYSLQEILSGNLTPLINDLGL